MKENGYHHRDRQETHSRRLPPCATATGALAPRTRRSPFLTVAAVVLFSAFGLKAANFRAPTQVAPANASTSVSLPVMLEWKPLVRAVVRYEYEINEYRDTRIVRQGFVSGTRSSVSVSLNPATKYAWRIRARGDRASDAVAVLGEWSEKQTFTTVPFSASPTLKFPADGTYRNPQTFGSGVVNVCLQWDPMAGAKAYEVDFGFAPAEVNLQRVTKWVGQTPGAGGLISGNPANILTIQTYGDRVTYWRVRAIGNTGVYGPWSEAASFGNIPTAPTLYLPADEVTSNGLTPLLVWGPASNAYGYDVSYCEGYRSDRNWQHVTVFKPRVLSLPTLKPKTWYTWKVTPYVVDSLGFRSVGPTSEVRTFRTP